MVSIAPICVEEQMSNNLKWLRERNVISDDELQNLRVKKQ